MRSQRLKDSYFFLVRPITKVNYLLYRHLYSFPFKNKWKNGIWVNLGSGTKYVDGFINIEGNLFHKRDIWLDIRNGLPFTNGSVDGVYACHMFEHFYPSELFRILSEAYRVLKQGAGIRILVPSLEDAIHAYLEGQKEWFSDFPVAYESLGGRFSNFLLCDGQHRLIFDFSFLHELLKKVGFSEVVREEVQRSAIFPRDLLEKVEDNQAEYIQTSLIVEAMK